MGILIVRPTPLEIYKIAQMIVYTLPFSKATIELYLCVRNVPSFSFLNTYAAPSNLEGIAGLINQLPITREGIGQVVKFQQGH